MKCANCGHPPSWHRLDDSLNISPTSPDAKFRCIGYDCEMPGKPISNGCKCPDFVGELPAPPVPDQTKKKEETK